MCSRIRDVFPVSAVWAKNRDCYNEAVIPTGMNRGNPSGDRPVEDGVQRMMTKKLSRSKHANTLELLALASPALLFIFVFSYLPLVGLIIPFKNTSTGTNIFKMKWAGLDNFKFLFTSPDSWLITRNTLLYNFVFIVLGTAVAILFALLLFDMKKAHVKVYQTVMFFPFFLSWVVGGYVVLGMLDMDYGLLNTLLKHAGIDPVAWYLETGYWPYIITFCALWKSVGYNTVIYYTALLGIDSELYSAASIDGADRIRQVIHISLPLLKPLVTLLVVLSIGRVFFGDFGLFYNVPGDSPVLYPVTDIIDTYVFRSLKKMGYLGMSSAAGFYQSVAGFLLVMATNWVVRKFDSENAVF